VEDVSDLTPTSDDAAVTGVTAPVLRSVIADQWNATMARYPTWATALGDHRFDDKLTDASAAAHDAWNRQIADTLRRLAVVPDEVLVAEDVVHRQLLIEQLRNELATDVCRFDQWSVSARSNLLVSANELGEEAVLRNIDDARALLARYRAYPLLVDQVVANLRAGLAAGLVENRESVSKVVEMLDAALALPVAESPMLEPAHAATPDWPEDEAAAWRDDLTAAVASLQPAFAQYRDVLRDEILPNARAGTDIGLHALPDGETCYAALIRSYTTLDRTPEVLHETGLAELRQVHDEFRALGQRVWGTENLAEIFHHLRTDDALFFDTAEEIRTTAEAALRRAEAAVPEYFALTPRTPCEVDVIPDYLAPYTTVAYYQQPRPDGSRPGTYFVNVYAPHSRPRHEAEVLAFHESVPGHHFQIAIAQERGELPAFRRYDGSTVFVEGWALYTERLADEMHLYSGDTDRLGMLSFDSWRAARLVVDTGLHAMGWSREQAEQFLLDNTPLAENNVVNEVDRYVTTAGQALAYKTGQLEIRRLRARAEEQLGPAFSLPEFHAVVLGGGAVSMPVLADRVDAWISRSGVTPAESGGGP
jgi:uncharacterized protein (DUF885 family)